MIQLISGEDRERLRGIYESELDSELPAEEQANIVAVIEDDELQAFMTAETLIRTDQWWVSPKYRNTSKASALIRKLARYLFANVPRNSSVIIFAANDNQGRLFTKLGFTEVENVRVYRLDR